MEVALKTACRRSPTPPAPPSFWTSSTKPVKPPLEVVKLPPGVKKRSSPARKVSDPPEEGKEIAERTRISVALLTTRLFMRFADTGALKSTGPEFASPIFTLRVKSRSNSTSDKASAPDGSNALPMSIARPGVTGRIVTEPIPVVFSPPLRSSTASALRMMSLLVWTGPRKLVFD